MKSGLSNWYGRVAMAAVAGFLALAGGVSAMAAATPPASSPASAAPPVPAGVLQVFFVDVEGGQSTLFVTPDKHSLLVDTGWNDNNGRDAKRIQAAMQMAHITRLDAVMITHYHIDHIGGVAELLQRVPVGMFLDHGENREALGGDTGAARAAYASALATGKYAHHVMHPGEQLPVPGFAATVVSADGKLIAKPLPGAGAVNTFCAYAGQTQPDVTENSRSLGIALQWGHARILDLGDLTRDKEKELQCPINKLGHVDLLVVSHHGWYQSSSNALVSAITPHVAVMDNGMAKGGSVPVLTTFSRIPSHPALWQLHYSVEGGQQYNTAAAQIANLQMSASQPDNAYMIRAAVSPDGGISVWNGRTGATTNYPPDASHHGHDRATAPRG